MTEPYTSLLSAAALGVVEGITEFLSISSTGHLILVNQFISFDKRFETMFDVVIQLGAILSVIVYFWKRLWPGGDADARKRTVTLWKKTIAGVVPALVIGGLFGSKVEEWLFNPTVVAISLAVGGVLLIVIESRRRVATVTDLASLTYRTAVAVGFVQCLAMVPGTSRSAATIIGAMLMGLSRVAAAEFSFFLAIPTMAAASGYSMLKAAGTMSALQWQALAVGFAVSFLVAWAVIAVFMRFIQKNDFRPFGWYRIALGAAVLAYFALR
jgi:undecaprenyl-diphosphatase